MRRFAIAIFAAFAVRAAAQEPDPVWAADLQGAREFASVLERSGEPSVAGLRLIQGPGAAATPPLPQNLDLSGIDCTGWLISGAAERPRLLFEDGLARTILRVAPLRKTHPNGELILPPGFVEFPLRRYTEWWTDGRRYREMCRGEFGAWRLAHWAAWHAQLKEDEMSVACWRAAMDVLDRLPAEFPRASPSDRFALAAVRSLPSRARRDEEAILQVYERLEGFSREKLEEDVAAEVAAIFEKFGKRHAHCAATLSARREAEAARAAWIGDWPRTNPAALDRPRQAEYWIRQLLNWNSASLETCAPGAFADSLANSGPSRELLALGDDALPALVSATGAPWPTRVEFQGRAVTIGDFCALLLEQITGESPLPRASDEICPGSSMKPEDRREAVAKWWSELEPLAPEQRWVALWKRGSRPAVEALLRIDTRRYLPDMVERIDRESGRKREFERHRLALAVRALPESTLRDLEDALPESCGDLVRAARRQ